jgi:glyceraldehyde-3-phosphate dehydrogenase/erythrose-4-phosphate dehydrogenase
MTRVAINGFGRIGGSAGTFSAPTSSADPTTNVSTDIVRSPYSCVFDSQLTMAQDSLIKVFGWYDNEWGYSCRPVDLIELVGAER